MDDQIDSNRSLLSCHYASNDAINGQTAQPKLNQVYQEKTKSNHCINLSTQLIDPNSVLLLDNERVEEIVKEAVALRDRIEHCVRHHYLHQIAELVTVDDEEDVDDLNGTLMTDLDDFDLEDQRHISTHQPIKRTETISNIFDNDIMQEVLQLESDLQGYINRSKSFSRSPRREKANHKLSLPLIEDTTLIQDQTLQNGNHD